MANRKYHSYLLFATHSHASEIFPGFLRELNLEDDNFRDVSRGLNFLKKKITIFRADFPLRSSSKSAKYNPRQN